MIHTWRPKAGAEKLVQVLADPEKASLCSKFLKSSTWGPPTPPLSPPPTSVLLGNDLRLHPLILPPQLFTEWLSQLLKKLQSFRCGDPTLQGGTLPAQGKSKFISFHASRRYWLHIVLMPCIITETALKICILYQCFIIPRIFSNPFSSTWTSWKYILASFMSSWNWIANSYCNENTYAPAWWYTTLHSNYGCALINLNWRVLSLNCW